MGITSIEWTDRTWNPVRGCSRVSQGCVNCYAERQAARFAGEGEPFHQFVAKVNGHPAWTGKVELVEKHLEDPLHWRKPCKVFVNSMSDLFHEALLDEAIDRVFAVMALCPQHTFQILTKRPERMHEYLLRPYRTGDIQVHVKELIDVHHLPDAVNRVFYGRVEEAKALFDRILAEPGPYPEFSDTDIWPLRNVWLGVSVEDQANKHRIDILRQVPAAVRFLSIEPLLEDIGKLNLEGIHWVIVGGESGPGARPLRVEWVRSIQAQCRTAEVACFVKQLGANPFEGGMPLLLEDRKGGDWDEWTVELRVREFPKILAEVSA